MTSLNQGYHNPRQKRTDRERNLFLRPYRDIEAQLECFLTLRLEHRNDARAGGNRDVLDILIAENQNELQRRDRLFQANAHDPNLPKLEEKAVDIEFRVRTVKEAFPIYRFCHEVLGANMAESSRERFKACCPLPGHEDGSPSFVVYEATDSAWCFGCQRGGDILELVGILLNEDRFFDRLEYLERLAGDSMPASRQPVQQPSVRSIRPPIQERRFVNGKWVA